MAHILSPDCDRFKKVAQDPGQSHVSQMWGLSGMGRVGGVFHHLEFLKVVLAVHTHGQVLFLLLRTYKLITAAPRAKSSYPPYTNKETEAREMG